jgi:hypothetical protein
MVWKLLKKNISAGQIFGYALANLVGLAIVLCAIRFYGDVQSAFDSDDSFVNKDYLIISKQVSTMNTIGIGGSTTFDEREVSRLKSQKWVREVGEFTAANFSVQMSMEFGGQGMSTFLFFEAIPDNFLDISPDDWHFDPTHPVVPVIMSKDYLTLYNFGFAASRGLPQLSETLIGNVPLAVQLSGNGQNQTLPARIVGFSSRLNTIAVPQEFMDWANGQFSATELPDPSRLIVEVNTPGDPDIERYMSRNGYEIAGDKADNSKASYFLTVVTSIVIAIGAIISVLAFFILMLSIYLLLQKNKQKLHDLMLLGYSPAQVARPYFMLVGIVNVSVLVLSEIIMVLAASWWQPRLQEIGVAAGSIVPAAVTGVLIIALVTTLNIIAIARIVRRNF